MNRIVYDSDHGRVTCPTCQRTYSRCKCKAPSSVGATRVPDDGIVRLRHEVRRGKPVTVVIGLPMTEIELRDFAKILKKKCSTGGSAKDGFIELQGDHREFLIQELEGRDYKVKLAGGSTKKIRRPPS